MKKRSFSLVIFLLLVFSFQIFTKTHEHFPKRNEKTWVFFIDKGFEKKELSPQIQNLQFSRKVQERRSMRGKFKNSENSILGDEGDLEINSFYLKEITKIIGENRIHTVSKWLNGITIWDLTESEKEEIENFSFVKEIKKVRKFKKKRKTEAIYDPSNNTPLKKQPNTEFRRRTFLNYGYSYQQLNQINVIPFHQQGNYGEGITIVVLDAGFHIQHESLQNINITDQWNFVDNSSNVDVSASHGTKCLALIGGSIEGKYYGPAFKANFLLGKTEDTTSESSVEEDNFAAALEWAEERGADVLSSSLGYTDWYSTSDYDGQTSIVTKAVNMAIERGLVCVISAGNEGVKGLSVPSDSYYVISVGAVDKNGAIGYFSSRGPTFDGRFKPEICATGVNTNVIDPYSDNNYKTGSGTSFAAPQIGGAVALILKQNPTWSPKQIRFALLNTASKKDDPDNTYGWGIANAFAASQFESNCDGTCNIPEKFDVNGYIYSCFNANSLECEFSGNYVCKKNESLGNIIMTGKTCEDIKYVCSKDNCAYECVNNVCTEKKYNIIYVIIRLLFKIITGV